MSGIYAYSHYTFPPLCTNLSNVIYFEKKRKSVNFSHNIITHLEETIIILSYLQSSHIDVRRSKVALDSYAINWYSCLLHV